MIRNNIPFKVFINISFTGYICPIVSKYVSKYLVNKVCLGRVVSLFVYLAKLRLVIFSKLVIIA